jgi:hypothetical protein
MKPDDELKELHAREARARAAILKLAAEVRQVLAEDLAQFPGREVRRRFVADPAFAATFDDARIAAVKADVAKRGAALRDRVVAAMEDPDLWLAGVDATGPGKSLQENERLWAATAEAVTAARQAMKAHGFPAAGDAAVEYRMPTWFIGGKYLPGLAEKYWALVGELRDLRQRIAELEQSRVRDALGQRWDKI